MPKEKMKTWTQRTPADIVKAAMIKGQELPDARALGLKKRNKLVNYLLEKLGSGKLVVLP